MKHLLKLGDLTSEQIFEILNLADQLKYNSSKPEVAGNVMFSYSKVFFPRTKAARSGIQQALSLWK